MLCKKFLWILIAIGDPGVNSFKQRNPQGVVGIAAQYVRWLRLISAHLRRILKEIKTRQQSIIRKAQKVKEKGKDQSDLDKMRAMLAPLMDAVQPKNP